MDKNTSTAYVEPTSPIGSALAPAGEAGTPLFLINLCASMAPVQLSSKTLPGLENYRLYQVTRVEDGRTRYRLRLGFFASEAEAEEVLARVREQYPTAFTACLCEEDKRHMRGYVLPAPVAKSKISVVPSAPKPVAAAPAAKPAAAVASKPSPASKAAAPAAKPHVAKVTPAPSAPATAKAKPTPAPAPKKPVVSADEIVSIDDLQWDAPAPTKPAAPAAIATGKHAAIAATPKTPAVPKAAAKATTAATPAKSAAKSDSAESMRIRAAELTFSDPPAPTPGAKPRSGTNEPFHVGKGAQIPTTALSLQNEPSASQPAAATVATANKPATAKIAAKPAVNTPAAKANNTPTKIAPQPAKVAASAPPKPQPSAKHPDLDSTQTIRALTSAELADDAQEKWFAIQLAASEQPVNLDTMPHLDIFEAYRLYSVATAGSGKIVHSLRLGFFKEAVSAEAVAGYLKTFFSNPTVLRISVAEQARFKDATMPKKPDPEVRAAPNVIELDSARASRVPTVTMEVVPSPGMDTSATGSFKPNATGSFRASETGSFRASETGSFRTSETAKHRALSSVKPAAKKAGPATKRGPAPSKKTSSSGKYKMPVKKSLAEQLLEEAKEVELSESGIYKMPKNDSLLSRLVDKLKK